MAEHETAEEKLAALREMIISARSMPMSASCVINRNDVLSAIDDVIQHLPDEIADAQDVLDTSLATIAESQDQAAQILAEARERGRRPGAGHRGHPGRGGRGRQDPTDAEEEAAALRRETDIFIDSRMASFESVLHKTTSQVSTARQRLARAERAGRPSAEAAAGTDGRSPRPGIGCRRRRTDERAFVGRWDLPGRLGRRSRRCRGRLCLEGLR